MMQRKGNLSIGLVISILVLATSPMLGATQGGPGKASWDNLKQLVPDQEVRVKLKDGKHLRGLIQTVTDDGIVVSLATGDRPIARQSILQISAEREAASGGRKALGITTGLFGGLFMGPGAGLLAGRAVARTGRWQVVYRAR